MKKLRIVFLGNFQVDYTTETHHVKSLETLGHEVIRLQEGSMDAGSILNEAMKADLFVWVHTHGWKTPPFGALDMVAVLKKLKKLNIPTITYHLDLWFGLNRQSDLEQDEFYKHIGHFFTVDKQMADWFNKNTEVKGHYLQAGVFDQECYMLDPSEARKDVVFVGSKNYHPEWNYRPQLVNWLEQNYHQHFKRYGLDSMYGIARGRALNQVYANSVIAVGDSLCLDFKYEYYWSDRVYETLGRGGFIIHPYIKGMEEHFTDREHLVFYEFGNFNQLRELINYYAEHVDERETIRLAGHNHVKQNHTYVNRWRTILSELGLGAD